MTGKRNKIIMKNSTLLQQIKNLLSKEVKLETMKMGDGVTVIEAETFEAGKEVFVVTEDEQRIAVPVGEYELEDGRILVIVEEGIISEVKEKEEEVEEVTEEEKVTEPVEEETMNAPVSTPKKTVEIQLKEIDGEKRILMGAALIPNKQIYRVNDKKEEYYIYFSEATVRKICRY